jgi:hypothetical protein
MQQVNPMGLRQLEWCAQGNNAWVARIVNRPDSKDERVHYMRFAHINLYEGHHRRIAGKHFVEFQFYKQNYDKSYHDSIDAAKLHVEAVFALSD